jgi:hypothetical protein
MLTRRGLIVAYELLAAYPLNIGGFDATSRTESCAMCFAAHAAMAKQHIFNRAVNFEGNALT